jgi:hypothetical protein
MQPFPIPVRAAPIIGPGSQPPDEVDIAVLAMPQGMNTFEMPRVPERADPAVLAAVRELLAGLLRQLDAWDPADADAPPVLDLAGVPPPVLAVANELLGEGEVSVKVAGEPELRIQESVFAGLWRCCAFDAQGVLHVADTARGALWKVAIGADGKGAAPALLVQNALLEGADGMAFDRAGRLWVASNEINAVVAVTPAGAVQLITRNTSAGPLEFPGSVVFVGDRAYVPNFDVPRRDNLDASGTTARDGVGASIAVITPE